MSEAYRSDETVTVDEPRESTPLRPATPEELKKWPRSIAFIMGNEGCERFSFYGLKAILLLYMTNYLLIEKDTAVVWMHAWISFSYTTAVAGGILSDAWLGKFWTIFILSIVYCIGSAGLSITAIPGVTGNPPQPWGLAVSLVLIAIGTGGIKSAVSSFVGDQFKPGQEQMMDTVYSLFYFMINTGSLLSTILTPLLKKLSYAIAFGIPAILLGTATLIFWLGRSRYVIVPRGENVFGTAFNIIATAFKVRFGSRFNGEKRESFLDYAKIAYSEQQVEDLKAVLRVLMMYLPLPMFWTLFDQHSTRWVLQATDMNLTILPNVTIEPEQVQALNPALTLLLVFVFDQGIYKLLAKLGIPFKSLSRIFVGMILTAASFGVAGAVQMYMSSQPHKSVSVWLIVPQFFVLSCGEVMVSVTGLQFAYSQAPTTMKSIVMAAWLSTVAIGNLLVVALEPVAFFSREYEFFIFGTAMLLCAAIFALLSQFYVYRETSNTTTVAKEKQYQPAPNDEEVVY